MNPVGSSDTAPHPIALGEILLDPAIISNTDTPEALNLAKAIAKHYADYDKNGNIIGGVAKEYLDMLSQMRKNPKVFLEAVRRTREEGRVPTEAEKWMDFLLKTDGKGIHHKYVANSFISYLSNIYFTGGIYKSRKIGKIHATHGYLKPAAHLNIKEGNVAVSSDNSTVYNRVINAWAESSKDIILFQLSKAGVKGAEKWSNFKLWNNYTRGMTTREKLDVLNEYLSENEVHALIHRQPIAKVTGVVTRRVQMLVGGGHGDTIFLRPKDVQEVLDGDWDGDHGFLEFLDDDLLDAYQKWQDSDTFKEKDKVVPLGIFGEKLEETESEVTYLSREAQESAVVNNAKASGSQGRVTNAKTVMTQLAYKNVKMFLGTMGKGVYISANNPSDSVIMDYIELQPDLLNRDDGKLLKLILDRNMDEIVDGEGNAVDWVTERDDGSWAIRVPEGETIHLKTTAEHEMSILLQMAVDNKKYGLLTKIGWDNTFILRRMFKRSDGKPLTNGPLKSLGILFQVQNFSAQRRGRTQARNVAGMGRIVEDSRTLARRFWDENGKNISSKESGKQMLQEWYNVWKTRRGDERKKPEIPSLITTNGSPTPGEILISSVGRAFDKIVYDVENPEQSGAHFLDWSENAYQKAHQKTVNNLGEDPMFDKDAWEKNELNDAYNYLVGDKHDVLDDDGNPTGEKINLNKAFWKIYKDAERELRSIDKSDESDIPIHISADYNQKLSKFVADHVESWLSLSDKAQDIVTIFLNGYWR